MSVRRVIRSYCVCLVIAVRERSRGGGQTLASFTSTLQYTVCCSTLQCVAVRCNVLQCVAVLSKPCKKDGRTVVVVYCTCFLFLIGGGAIRACKPAIVVYIYNMSRLHYNITENKDHCNNKTAVWDH